MAISELASTGATTFEQQDEVTPQPRRLEPKVSAQLAETSSGWVLTLTLDQAAARALQPILAGGEGVRLDARRVTVSITPNLVPGQPFALDAIEVALTY